MATMLCTGTLSTITSKFLNEEKSHGYHFHHPYFQAFSMFIGEAFCLVAYKIYVKFDPSISSSFDVGTVITRSDQVISKMGRFVYMFPTILDLISSSLSYLGLIFIAPSVYQMMKGFLIVVVAFCSVVFLKRKLYRHQIVGCTLATVGVIIVGTISILFQASSASNPILGAVLVIIAQFFSAGMFVIEELFFKKIKIDPLYAVGLEGIFGIMYFAILLPAFYFIPCDLNFCIAGRVEDSLLAFEQIGSNFVIAICWTSTMVIIALFNWSGISTTKHSSALARSTLNTAKTILVWICSMLIGWEVFLWPQLIGFVILAIGTMIYNEVLVIPILGLKASVDEKREQKQREEKIEETLKNNENESFYHIKSESTVN
jgi:uncharacterized membrane protein